MYISRKTHGVKSPPPLAVVSENKSAVISSELSKGSIFDGKYRILEFLGSGGFSRVYKATHIHLKKIVALKVLHEQYASDKEKQERLTREARAIMTLKHPGIVGLHDFAYCNGRAYLVMDYVEGASLAELLMNGTRFSVEECLQIANQTCAALTAAHAHGIIHRDLKPANIMVLRAHEGKQIIVKLLDFGLALQQDGDSLIAKTKTGEVIGTPAYMSPEQCLGQQLDLRSDIYSLGCVLYEIMFGVKAFSAETALALMLLHINEMPAAPSQRSLDAQLSHAVEAAILKALAKKPQDRYKSAEEMYAAISKSCSGKQNSIETKLHLIRSRFTASRPDPRGLIIIALLLLFCGTFFWDHFAIVPRWVQLKQAAISQMYDERINSMTALKTLREAVDEMDRAQAPKQEIAILRSMLGDCTFVMGKTEDALSYYEQSLEDAQISADNLTLTINLNHYARCLIFLRQFDKALSISQKSVAIASQLPEKDRGHLRDCLMTLGALQYNRNGFPEAEAALSKAWKIESEQNPAKHTKRKAIIAWELSKVLLAEDKQDEAHKMFETSTGISKSLFGSGADSIVPAQLKEFQELSNMTPPRFKPEFSIIHYSFMQTRRH